MLQAAYGSKLLSQECETLRAEFLEKTTKGKEAGAIALLRDRLDSLIRDVYTKINHGCEASRNDPNSVNI